MMDRVRPHRAMRDSGVDWLGAVPAHWEVRRLKYLLQESDARSVDGSEQLLRVSRYTGISRRLVTDFAQQSETRAVSLVDYKRVEPGDLVVNIMLAWNGSMGVSQFFGITSPAYCVYHFRSGTRAWYFHYLLRTLQYQSRIRALSTGVVDSRLRLYTDDLYRLEALVPPVTEQTAIVRFLDHADDRIQRYIRTKEKLIALLEEQRQAVIHQAVTGQIDVRTGERYPAYKDSGVEWLRDVPEQWRVAQLRRVALARCDGPFGSGLKSSHYTTGGVRVVRLQNIGHGEFRESDAAFISHKHYSSLGDHSVIPGDVLVAGLGDANHPAGRACIAPGNIGPAMVKADCFRFRLDRSEVEPLFVAFQLTSTAVAASAILSTGATRSRTNLQSTSARLVAVPTTSEQRLIVEFVSHAASSIRAVQRLAQREIAALREYRERLIADVVTGRLDVRSAAAGLSAVDSLTAQGDAGGDSTRRAGSAAVVEAGERNSVSAGLDPEPSVVAARQLLDDG